MDNARLLLSTLETVVIRFEQSVKARLWLLISIFVTAILVLLFQGVSALRGVGLAATHMGNGKDIVADILPPPLYLIETHLIAHELQEAPFAERKALANRFIQLKKDYIDRNAYWQSKSSDIDPAVITALFGQQKQSADAYWKTLEADYLPAILENRMDEAERAFKELTSLYERHRLGVDATVKSASSWAEAGLSELSATVERALVIFSVVAAASIIIGIIVSQLMMRSIVVPLSRLQDSIGTTEASSDFTRTVPVEHADEVGKTAASFNQLLSTLRAAFSQIQDGVIQIHEAAGKLSSSSNQQAANAGHQSAAASSMAATIEQVSVSIHHVSESALQAALASKQSGDLSKRGGDVIREAVVEIEKISDTVHGISLAIEDLGQQSQQISSVVQVIKEVAEQTNLLALNAAIEAARAGEQGRGFAVVADEVRKLAERTSMATDDIASMIQAIQSASAKAIHSVSTAVEQANGGVTLAQEAGQAINQIEDGARHVIELVDDISTALAQQSAASHDIAAHVEKVAQMAEENSGASGENADATVQLEKLASHMHEVVAKFKI